MLRGLPLRRREQRVVERDVDADVVVVLVEHELPVRPDLDARRDPAAAAALVVHEADVLHLRRVARRRLEHAHEQQPLGVDPELLAVVVALPRADDDHRLALEGRLVHARQVEPFAAEPRRRVRHGRACRRRSRAAAAG